MKKRLMLLVGALLAVALLVSLVGCSSPSATTTTTTPSSTPVGTTSTQGASSSVTTTQAPTTSSGTGTTGGSHTTTTPSATTSLPIVSTPTTSSEPEPTVPEPAFGTKLKVTYEVSNPYAGSLLGTTTQTVYYGRTETSSVGVTVNLGYKFVGWSDGKTELTRSGDCPRENTTYTAIFEYDALELPILSLFTDSGEDITDKYNYVPGTISVYNAPEGFNFENMTMEIRGRGNYTWNSTFNPDPLYNKRPYRIKLSEKMNLLGQGNTKNKSWVLIANHCDQSLLRNQTVMNFARSLTGIVWEPSASSVEVFLNGAYIGVYMLTEQVQINDGRIELNEEVELSEEIDFLAHRSGYAFNEPENNSFYYDNEPYEVVSDISTDPSLAARQMAYIQSRIAECWDAIKYDDKETILSLIDIDSVIDTYIVHEVFKNLDTGHDNFYMFAAVDGKLHFGPVWDFDQCAGNADIGVEVYEGMRASETNNWFRNLTQHDWFKEMVLARWEDLSEEINAIPDTIRAQGKAYHEAYCRNFIRWPIWGYKINRETQVIRDMHTYDEHNEYFATWMENRIRWLDNYFHSSQYIQIKAELALTGNGTKQSPYLVTSAADFYNFTQVMAGGETFSGKYFKQTADIDMTSIGYYLGIGAPNTFDGTYDGGGHTIHAVISGGADTTFFPYVTGTVMNLMTTGSINNSGHVAGIARSVRVGGKIVNCGSTMALSSSGGNAGGIVTSNQEGGGAVIGCWFGGTLNSNAQLGPINVFLEGRTTDVFAHNYYINTFVSEDRLWQAAIREETPVSANNMAVLHTKLNNALSSVASAAGLSASDLCHWTSQNNFPAPVAKS